jgi:hypothetical protein
MQPIHLHWNTQSLPNAQVMLAPYQNDTADAALDAE